MRTDIEKMNVQAIERDKTMIRTVIGVIIGSVTIMGICLALFDYLT